jgi:hypothetical protein
VGRGFLVVVGVRKGFRRGNLVGKQGVSGGNLGGKRGFPGVRKWFGGGIQGECGSGPSGTPRNWRLLIKGLLKCQTGKLDSASLHVRAAFFRNSFIFL